jgi:hypothetical protein
MLTWGERKKLKAEMSRAYFRLEKERDKIDSLTPEQYAEVMAEAAAINETSFEVILTTVFSIPAEEISKASRKEIVEAMNAFIEENTDPDTEAAEKKAKDQLQGVIR